jgi:hypothetical protein
MLDSLCSSAMYLWKVGKLDHSTFGHANDEEARSTLMSPVS